MLLQKQIITELDKYTCLMYVPYATKASKGALVIVKSETWAEDSALTCSQVYCSGRNNIQLTTGFEGFRSEKRHLTVAKASHTATSNLEGKLYLKNPKEHNKDV